MLLEVNMSPCPWVGNPSSTVSSIYFHSASKALRLSGLITAWISNHFIPSRRLLSSKPCCVTTSSHLNCWPPVMVTSAEIKLDVMLITLQPGQISLAPRSHWWPPQSSQHHDLNYKYLNIFFVYWVLTRGFFCVVSVAGGKDTDVQESWCETKVQQVEEGNMWKDVLSSRSFWLNPVSLLEFNWRVHEYNFFKGFFGICISFIILVPCTHGARVTKIQKNIMIHNSKKQKIIFTAHYLAHSASSSCICVVHLQTERNGFCVLFVNHCFLQMKWSC